MESWTEKELKGYQLIDRIGTGAVGAVYEAYQEAVGRDVAVKIIRSEYANLLDFIRRFEGEAQAIASLEHLHIVPLYDYWLQPHLRQILAGEEARDER